MRLFAAWQALTVLAHALAVGAGWAAGRAHRHAEGREARPMVLWRHAAPALDAHARAHADGQAHHHAIDDASVLPSGSDAAADAAGVLTFLSAPAPHGSAAAVPIAVALDHVWSATTPWAATAHTVLPPRRPPRA
jgi:hypothetical protein